MTPEQTDQLWRAACGELALTISPSSYSLWIVPCFLVSVTTLSDELYLAELATPSTIHSNTIDQRWYGQIKAALEKQLERKCELALVVRQKPKVEAALPDTSLFSQEAKDEDLSPQIREAGLNPKLTFDNFVVGGSNDLAYAAAKAIVEAPGTKHNPLFIWGGVGVGKTHLMHAVGRALLEKGFKKVRVLTSEAFTNELIETLRNKKNEVFKTKYRSADAFLIDDIQFIAGKEKTQEEFFHTFNELYSKQKQIIMTSDRRPQDIGDVEQRLISRFLGGLTVDIGIPDYEMRCAILRQKAEEMNIVTGEGAIETMANNISTNARELEGHFISVVNAASTRGSILTQEIVESQLHLKASGPRTMAKKPRPQEVISTIAKHFNVKNKDLVGHNRQAELVRARQIAMYFLREDMGLQLQRVARLMGNRDHTTVMYGVKKMQQEFGLNQEVRQDIMALRGKLFE